MRYVIIRDDDTNAFTPVECLEKLYRPFLDRGLPVNLATIPAVSTAARMADGTPEGFLWAQHCFSRGSQDGAVQAAGLFPCAPLNWAATTVATAEPATACSKHALPAPGEHAPIGQNQKLVAYLKDNPGFKIIQHGCHHDYLEFDCADPAEVARRLDAGRRHLQEAGLTPGEAFVAPYDRLSRPALREVSQRFRILSTGWYELRRLPWSWWPGYMMKKLKKRPHWRVGRTLLLSHPGCLLSCHRTYSTMLGGITHFVENQQLTVVVTHWWEYFRNGRQDEGFIEFLHETAAYLASHPDVKVVSFSDLLTQNFRLN
jgi:hypothetical protein